MLESSVVMKISRILCLAFLLIFADINHAQAIDLQPGEIRAPKPDYNLVQLSYQQTDRGDKYLHGDKQSGSPEVSASQLQVRLGRTFEVAEHPAIFYIQTPMGYVHPDLVSKPEGDAGMGDTSMLLAFWPYANRETETYLAIGAYLTLPTGSYDNKRSFNVGQNRYSSALQLGLQTALSKQLHWMAALDAVKFGDNNEFGVQRKTLEQNALYTAQAGLRYDLNATYSIGATYFYTVGGETIVNGINRDDVTRLNRYQLSGILNSSFGRITLQYGRDIDTENGYIEDSRWILRYTKLF